MFFTVAPSWQEITDGLSAIRMRVETEDIQGISTTWRIFGVLSPFSAESSAPRSRATTLSASTSFRIRTNSCSLVLSTSYGFFIREGLLLEIQDWLRLFKPL